MSCEKETAVVLREAGQKVTPQRVLILCAVRHAGAHVTASGMIDALHSDHPYIDASTVYRTLAAANDLGLVCETDMGGGESEFEWIGINRHHHLICRNCGGVNRWTTRTWTAWRRCSTTSKGSRRTWATSRSSASVTHCQQNGE